jgi:hypothetical protein
MDNGMVAEYDSPINLFDGGGIFRSMCDRSGITKEHILSQNEASEHP